MLRGDSYYGIMLVCVLVITTGTIYMLAQAPPAINSTLAQSQGHVGGDITKGVAIDTDANLLVRARGGNIAPGSSIPCCANAASGGCGQGVANCTYSSGSGLSCFSNLFDTDTGSCA